MANERKRIKVLGEVTELTDNHYFIVDDAGTGGATKKYNSSHIIDQIRATMAKGTASGAVATFTDGADGIPMTDLVVSIEPQQDLHGYDSPWVGGAGKNKYDKNNTNNQPNKRVSTGSGGTYTADGYTASYLVEVEPDTDYTLTTSASFVSYICWYDETQTRISGTNWSSGTSKTSPSNAKYIRFDFSTANIDTVQLEQGTTATAFAPYSNECPISGWTACNVVRTGRNWFDEYLELGDINGTTGQETPSTTYLRSNYIYVGSSSTYYFRTPNTIRKWIYCFDENKNIMDTSTVILGNTNSEFTLPQNCCYIRFLLNKDAYGSSTYQNDICINIYDTSFNGQYEPFGNTYTINFVDGSSPLTVYGGTLDVLSGGLDDIQKSFTLDGTETISMGTSGGKTYFTASISSKIGGYSYNTSPTNKDLFISSHFKGDNSINYGNFYITGGGGTIVFLVEGITSESAMTTWLTNNTPQFVVPLATPQTYQLTPTQVKSLLGVNNIFADTGNIINAEYVRDTTTIINQILARLDVLES